MTDHYRLVCCGDACRVGVPAGTDPLTAPHLAYWLASHAGHALQVTRYEVLPPVAVRRVKQPPARRRKGGPQMEMRR